MPPPSEAFKAHLALLPPLLKAYKTVAKALLRDRSLPYAPLKASGKELAGWIEAAEVLTGRSREGIRAFASGLIGGDDDDENIESILVPLSLKYVFLSPRYRPVLRLTGWLVLARSGNGQPLHSSLPIRLLPSSISTRRSSSPFLEHTPRLSTFLDSPSSPHCYL